MTSLSTAQVQGQLWGTRPQDYAELIEPWSRPLYEAVFEAAGVGEGTWLLDVGCGPGLAAQIVARRGAHVAGLDAAETSLEIARKRTPHADFRAGEMEDLPWADNTFDVVTGFNAFQYASDAVNALREARRVARPGGRVAMAALGSPEHCDIAVLTAGLGKLLPPPPPGAPGPFALSAPGRIEALLEQAGLSPLSSAEVDCPLQFPDLETAVRANISSGPSAAAVRQLGAQVVQQTLAEALAQFRAGDGTYRLRNRLRYVIAAV